MVSLLTGVVLRSHDTGRAPQHISHPRNRVST
jgi:hypothetical protein